MNNKEYFDLTAKFSPQTPEQRIEVLVNKLIDGLYCPSQGDITETVDYSRLEKFGIDKKEPINWGALHCIHVELIGDIWDVTIEEAMPASCPTLCSYIERFMKSWGWDVRVNTEW